MYYCHQEAAEFKHTQLESLVFVYDDKLMERNLQKYLKIQRYHASRYSGQGLVD